MVDTVFYRREVSLEDDEPEVMVGWSGDGALDDPATFETATVAFEVPVVEEKGDEVTIEFFGDQLTVPKAQTSIEKPSGMGYIPALRSSPYTSMEEAVAEVSAMERDDGE